MRGDHSAPAAFRIRPAHRTDGDVLAHLHREASFAGWNAAALDDILQAASTRALVAETSDTALVCGFLLARFVAEEGEILTIGVHRGVQGRGVATALLGQLIGMAADENLERLFLEVSVDNVAALALYRRQGFREVGRRRGYYTVPGAEPVDAWLLALELAQPAPEPKA